MDNKTNTNIKSDVVKTVESQKSSKRRSKGKGLPALKDMSERERQLHRNAEILRMMPDNISDSLAKARTKPVWCSDIRWRMELKRRAYFKW